EELQGGPRRHLSDQSGDAAGLSRRIRESTAGTRLHRVIDRNAVRRWCALFIPHGARRRPDRGAQDHGSEAGTRPLQGNGRRIPRVPPDSPSRSRAKEIRARAGARSRKHVSEPIGYIERTRDYYAALGYAPYRWAEHADVPFVRPRAPLARSRLVLLTTAAPYPPELPDQGPGAAYNAAAKFYHVYDVPVSPTTDLRSSHIGYDRVHTTARDPNTWLPVARLFEAVGEGRIGALAERVIGVPTNRSQRVTMEQDAPEVLARARTLDAELALLVPNCPVCHQSMSLIARYLEANGIATVVMGCALDIVERCGVPRFLFRDFPLRHSAGRPF